jgi:hypothetical protein
VPKKSVRMLRAGKHVVVVNGRGLPIKSITQDGESYAIDLGDNVILHRTANAKVEIR